MKPKDIGFVQQHIEKIILGVALLFVLIVLWLYFLGSPYSVTLGDRDKRTVAPKEVMDVVAQKSRQLDGRLKDTRSPLPETPVPDYTTEFVERYKRRPLSIAQFSVPMNEAGVSDFEAPTDTTRIVVMPPVPAPTGIKARGGFNVLADLEDPQQIEPLIKLVGNQIPRDFKFASTSVTFSLAGVQEALKSVPAQERIPEAWWRGRLLITSVQLQRQEFEPATGQWSKEITVPHLPAQVAYGLKPAEYDRLAATQVLDQIAYDQDLIQRTPFPPTIQPWTPPEVEIAELNPEDQRRLLRLNAEIGTLRQQIERLERRGAAPAERQPRPVVRGPREMEGVVTDVMRPPGPATPEGTGQLDQLRRQLAEKTAERNKLMGIEATPVEQFDMPMEFDGRFDEFGQPIPGRAPPRPGMGRPVRPPGAGPAFVGEPGQPGAADMTGDIKIWAHDLTVQPGRVYRYRVIVHLLNPLFQKQGIDPEQEKENYHKLAVASEPSAWSDPVQIEPDLFFFLTRAQASSAQIEIWRIFNGVWENHVMNVRPGELMGEDKQIPVNEQPMTVPMKVNGIVVDLREVSGGSSLRDSTFELLYVDLESRELKTRNLLRDQNDKDLIRLRAEKARGAVALQP